MTDSTTPIKGIAPVLHHTAAAVLLDTREPFVFIVHEGSMTEK